MGFVQTKITEPNGKVTDLQYDGYGRLQKVWLPTENKATDPATLEFVYDAATRPANMKSRQLRVKSSRTYLDSWAYVDSFGRDLQTQTPAMAMTPLATRRVATSAVQFPPSRMTTRIAPSGHPHPSVVGRRLALSRMRTREPFGRG